jgi:hypothetical protein
VFEKSVGRSKQSNGKIAVRVRRVFIVRLLAGADRNRTALNP